MKRHTNSSNPPELRCDDEYNDYDDDNGELRFDSHAEKFNQPTKNKPAYRYTNEWCEALLARKDLKTMFRCPRDARFRGNLLRCLCLYSKCVPLTLRALVRVLEVPMNKFPIQCLWCVPLPVPVVRFFLVLHMHNRTEL